MQPQYPTQPVMPQYPQQPGYPPAQPQYPAAPVPANPYANPYGVAPGAQQAPAVYGGPQYPAAPATPPPPAGTLDGFFDQPSSGGGPAWKFNGKPIGTSYAGIVARAVTNADVRHQTNNAGQVQTYRDGRPKLVMVVPMQVQPSPEFPDGVAGWWVKGQARDELARAMAEAGAPAGAPEARAAIRVTLVGQRPIPNMNPANQYRVEYMRPSGAAPAPAPTYPGTVMQPPPAPAQQTETAPVVSTATGQPVVHQQPIPQQPAQAPMPQPAAAEQPQQPAPAPAGFNADQAALFAKLTGQPAA